jgi:hypothetical protein
MKLPLSLRGISMPAGCDWSRRSGLFLSNVGRKAVVISNLCKGTAKTFLSVLREIRDDDSCGNSNLRLLHVGLDCTGRS